MMQKNLKIKMQKRLKIKMKRPINLRQNLQLPKLQKKKLLLQMLRKAKHLLLLEERL